uniref:Polygalacturonase (PG) ) n=1 Tax=Ganoderma boninense TaxID=34458 RepID=A0A5K1JUX0_9APHY|nr:Polygalacturonase (PG) (EC (Pectinase) [Ganoderma boninense]
MMWSLMIHRFSSFNRFTMEVLVRLFPNLDNTLVIGTLKTVDAEDLYPNVREWSRKTQKSRAWSRLYHAVCDASSAFLKADGSPMPHS